MRIENVVHRFHRYAFVFDYDPGIVAFCRVLKEKYTWKEFGFDGEGKRWVFSKREIAEEIIRAYPFVAMDADIGDVFKRERIRTVQEKVRTDTALTLKSATDSAFIVKHVKGELYPYQKIGVEFLINANGRAILASEMGLGKSFQAIAYAAHEGLKRILVVSPASVKYAWENEVKKWTRLRPHVITSRSNPKEFENRDVNVFIINYDLLKRFFSVLQMMRFDLIICDEGHFLKALTSQRFKLMRVLAINVPRLIFLSGTPFMNRPSELYTLLDMLEPKKWGSWLDFTRIFCAGHKGRFGWDHSGVSNVEQLKNKIAPLFLRHLKKDVLTELPEKTYVNIPVELDQGSQRDYDHALKDFKDYLLRIKKKSSGEVMRAMQAEKFVRLGELRQIASRGKLKAANELITQILQGGEKVIVFSCYNAPLEELKEEYKEEAVMIIGSTEEKERQMAVDRFQNDPNVKVFLGGMKSASTGITLTAASNVVFLDFSWVPADHWQASDRVHRIGQKNAVVIYNLFCRNTVDEKMVDILEMKERIFKKVLDEGVQGKLEENVIEELIKSLEE